MLGLAATVVGTRSGRRGRRSVVHAIVILGASAAGTQIKATRTLINGVKTLQNVTLSSPLVLQGMRDG